MKFSVPSFLTYSLTAFALSLASLSVMAQNTGSAGGGQAVENRQPSLAVTYVICTQGTYPARGGGLGTVDLTQPLLGEIRAMAFDAPEIPKNFALCAGQTLSIASNTVLFSILGTIYGGNGSTTFQLPDLRGRTPIGADSVNYILGGTYGVEQETLTVANLPAHSHTSIHGSTGSTGSAQAFNNLQPSLAINYCLTTTGQIMMFAGNFAPSGWAFCDGSLYPMTAQPILFNYIGTTFGGDGISTFAVPDLRGRAPVGAGQSVGLSSYVLGQTSGSATVNLSMTQMPVHSHSLPGGGSTDSTGGSLAFDNRQPTLGLGWAICLNGIFPTSSSTASFPLIGELRLFAGSSTSYPSSFAQVGGQAVSIASYSPLFALIGTTYGGNGTTSFNLPDLRSRLALSTGQGSSATIYTLGMLLGTELNTLTANQMPAHTHLSPAILSVQTSAGTVLTNGSAISFGNAALGTSGQTSLIISNAGGLALNITMAVSGTNAADFTTQISQTNLSGVKALTDAIGFSPARLGSRSGTLAIANNDSANSPFTIYLAGDGSVVPPKLVNPQVINGSLQFSFTNDPSAQFTILTATNLLLPLSNWTVLGLATNTGGDNFQFSVPVTPNQPNQFYRVRSP